jgi:hypothetical protein
VTAVAGVEERDATAPPRVGIVLLNWNGREDVLNCLSTLPRLRYDNWEATVIDNASTDGSVEAVRGCYPAQRVLVMERNLGFTGGNNRGIADALARGADYVLLLNNDTEMHPDLVTELVRVARTDRGVGAVGAKNLRLGDPSIVWGAWNELVYDEGLVRVVGQGRPDGPEYTGVHDVEGVIGNGMMMSRSALSRVGGFDESYFGYHEDIDWCLRARAAGFRVVYCGAAVIHHRGFGAADPTRDVPFPVLYFLGRNGVLFARKHGTRAQQLRFARRYLGSVLRQGVAAAARGERVKPYLWMLRGFADGLLGRLPLAALKVE